MQIALRARVQGESKIRAMAAGRTLTADLKDAEPAAVSPLGRIRVEQAGYVRVDLQGIAKTGPVYAEASDLEITSATPDLALSHVKDNEADLSFREGSGGQNFLVYPWQSGSTQRFLNRAKPDGKGNTVYTAWFRSPATEHWQLIANIRRNVAPAVDLRAPSRCITIEAVGLGLPCSRFQLTPTRSPSCRCYSRR